MSQRVGLCGGSFDPIHHGHLVSARSIAERHRLDRLVLIPSARPPHKQGIALTDPLHRLAMARLAVEGDGFFEVSDMEMRRAGPSYTFDTVTEFRKKLGPSDELFWIIGADTLPELPTWYRIAELVSLVRIVTATRPGWQPPDTEVLSRAIGIDRAQELLANCLPTPPIDVSATDIRARVKAGLSIEHLVPTAVASYIEAHALYR